MIKNISGVILAGGSNKRFNGTTKSNILIGGKTIISRIIETISGIFDEIIIVTNTPEEFTEHNNYRIISDHFLKAGPLGGLHAAMEVSAKDAIFAFAGDMPFLEKKLIIRQINRFLKENCEALVPRVNKYTEPLHSVYSNSLLIKLEKYLTENNEYAVRDFLKRIDVNYFNISESDKFMRSFTNINSPSDLRNIKKFPGNISTED